MAKGKIPSNTQGVESKPNGAPLVVDGPSPLPSAPSSALFGLPPRRFFSRLLRAGHPTRKIKPATPRALSLDRSRQSREGAVFLLLLEFGAEFGVHCCNGLSVGASRIGQGHWEEGARCRYRT